MGVCRVCRDKALRRVFQRDGGYASDNADPSSEVRGIKIQIKPILKTKTEKILQHGRVSKMMRLKLLKGYCGQAR